MKLKNWLILSYIIVMFIPILTGMFLYKWIQSYDNQRSVVDYFSNVSKFDKYAIKLQDPNIYIHPKSKYDFVEKNEKDTVEIELYDKYGINFSSSIKEQYNFIKPREQLYSKLYEIEQGSRMDILRKPVFDDNEIVGFYEISILKTEWIEGINIRTILAFVVFISVFIAVLIIVVKLINRKLNIPMIRLVDAMGNFASGKSVELVHKSNDEIGELILHFNNMKSEIEEKRVEVLNEQKSKEYMVAAISHDLKTPITSIRAYGEILNSQSSLVKEDKDRYTSVIINKCDYMTQMLDDLLSYTLLPSHYKMEFVSVDGQEFFEMLFSDYEKLCEKNGLTFESEVIVSGNYKVDVKQMIRVVDNLMSNAIRHTQRGKRIYLGAYSNEYPLPDYIGQESRQELSNFRKDGLIIIVKNEGIEIGNKDIELIFSPFYQVDKSRSKGNGLGLSIVKLIIEKHQGKVKVLSNKDEGIIIACYLKKGEYKNE